jgi:beta-N-acetylhexosaminidase
MKISFNPSKIFILGFHGLTPSSEFLNYIEKNPPAGFLLLGENYQDNQQLKSLIFTLKTSCGTDTIIMADQEPGRVQRFKGLFPISKRPKYYLHQSSTAEYRAWCCQTSEMMRELGINMNLAPVVDLWPPDKEFRVLDDRAFGSDIEKVAEYATILIEEFKKNKIATCAKHFPGLGSAIGDPHDVLSKSAEKLEQYLDYHWKPFKAAIRAGVDAVMTTHLLSPALDSRNCATYSPNIISHLRNTVGHNGPIISDDLCMSGAHNEISIGQAAVDSILAGHNLLIIARDINLQAEAVEAIKSRSHDDELIRNMAIESCKKVKSICNVT